MPEWINAPALVWIVPILGVALGWLASEIKNRGRAEASVAAIHRRLNEMRDAVLQLSETVSEIRDVVIARGLLEPQRSSPSRPPIPRDPLRLK